MSSTTANRRRFFRWLARDAVVLADEARGRPQMSLQELPKLPPDVLAQLVPMILHGMEISLQDGAVKARPPGGKPAVVLFPANEAGLVAFNGFNGQTTMDGVARQLAAELGWESQHAFSFVRDLFLRLVRLGVCVPCNLPAAPAHAARAPAPGRSSREEEGA